METSVSLLERLAGSPDDADWRRLNDLYQPLLRAWMARSGVGDADLADLAQEVLLVVFREVGAFERRGLGAFRGWLRTILANRVRTHFRAAKRRPAAAGGGDGDRLLDDLESPDSDLSARWNREHDEHVAASLMRRVSGDFAPATWAAFQRHVLEGEPAAAVADGLGLSLNSVLLAKSRVLKRMRAELAGLTD